MVVLLVKKSLVYERTKFAPEVIQEAVANLSSLAVPSGKAEIKYWDLRVTVENALWPTIMWRNFFQIIGEPLEMQILASTYRIPTVVVWTEAGWMWM